MRLATSLLFVLPITVLASAPSSVTLGTSANPSVFGKPVTLTATVSPSGATGAVTFYEGAAILEIVPLTSGAATLTTTLLNAGAQSLKAYYSGNGSLAASTSSVVTQTVNAVAGSRFTPAVSYGTTSYLYMAATGDFNGDGKVDVAVVGVNEVSVLLGNGDGTFQTAVNYAAGSAPQAVAVGDFNGDGKPDLAVASAGSDAVSILLGNGDGTFQAATTYSAGVGPFFLAVADFNGDGKADIVTANYSGGNISVLIGNGDGTFQSPVNYTTDLYPRAVAIGDFNGDGVPDLAVANFGNNNVSVLLGNGDGTFQTAVNYTVGNSPQSLTAADFRGDGNIDLAVANEVDGTVSVLLGNGNGTFQTQVTYTAGVSPYGVAVSDFNGDGKLDLAFAAYGSDGVNILLGNGDGTFQPVVTYGSGGRPAGLVVADFNGDGRADVATANQLSGNMSVLLGYSSSGIGITASSVSLVSSLNPSQFGQPITLTATVTPSAATGAVTFYNGTTILETEPVNSGNAVLHTALLPFGTGTLRAEYSGNSTYAASTSSGLAQTVNTVASTQFESAQNENAGSGPYSVAAADFNGDGKPDIAVANYTGNTVSVFLGTGGGNFTLSGTYSALNGPLSVAVGDFNGDGKPDLVLADYGSSVSNAGNTVSVLLGNGDGTFQAAVNYETGNAPWTVVVADFNGDGYADLAVANAKDNTVSVLLGNGDGSFRDALTFATGTNPDSVAVGDFNGDGKPDLAVANYADNTVSVLLGNGDGTFQTQTVIAVGSGPESIAVGDFTGNGKLDLAVANNNSNNVSILLGNGNGAFQAATNFSAGSGPYSVVAGDVNGDGIADLAVADYSANTLSILTGSGTGSFSSPTTYAVGTGPVSVALADFNGDGRVDFAVANNNSNNVSILLGATGTGGGSTPSTTTLTSSLNPSAFGQAVTLTATVSPSSATGTVTFADGSTTLASANLSSGVATFTTSTLGTGSQSLSATYNGNSTYQASVGTLTQVVSLCASASPTSIVVDANGGPVTLNVTAASGSCAWTIASDSGWLTVNQSSGSGSTAVTVTIAANSTGQDLSGNLTLSVGGQTSTVVPVVARFTPQIFNDVPPSAYYFDAANLMYQKGITTGCSASPPMYCPNNTVTRAQMAVFLVTSIYGSDTFPYNPTPYFTDVPAGAFAFQWIQAMYGLGITSGCGTNLFCPNENVTRAQMAVFIIRMRYGSTAAFDYVQTPFFSDVPADAFGFAWIQRMKMDNITGGCSPTLYCPNNSVIRGDMSIFIMDGGFNALLPVTEPILTSISPSTLSQGASGTFTVTGKNTNFVNGTTTIAPIPGVTVGTVTVTSPTTLTVLLTASGTATQQPVSILAITGTPPGNQEAVLPNGLAIQ